MYLYRLLHLETEPQKVLKIDPPPQRVHTCPICLEELDIYTNCVSCKSDKLSNIDQDDHIFCAGCIEQHIASNVFELPLSADSDGIKCPQHGCNRKIMQATLRQILPEISLKRLDERLIEQNLAPFKDIERCKACNFAMQIDVDKKRMLYFTCLACGAFFCRTCKRDGKPGHIGKTCEELDWKDAQENNDRRVENEMCDAVIRRCPNCALPFLKQDGCNKMTCRCGTTQCYICRVPNITYDHFCTHERNAQIRCVRCNKTCLLWQDADAEDERVLQGLRRRIIQN